MLAAGYSMMDARTKKRTTIYRKTGVRGRMTENGIQIIETVYGNSFFPTSEFFYMRYALFVRNPEP
jgi:methyl coenzyme M reductase gamma subunit